MKFYLGTHNPHWLNILEVPLFVSRRRLGKNLRRFCPKDSWALDSGGYSELSLYGTWRTTAEQYVAEVQILNTLGGMDFAASQDWMCEPWVLAKTGLSVSEHQQRTVANYILLCELAPELPWLPVIQGYKPHEYLQCVRLYEEAGVHLNELPRVGLGSVCRRQATGGIDGLAQELATEGIRLHGFGIKLSGLPSLKNFLISSDSLAWSFDARRLARPLPECETEFRLGIKKPHKNCANCMRYALRWREKVLAVIGHKQERNAA